MAVPTSALAETFRRAAPAAKRPPPMQDIDTLIVTYVSALCVSWIMCNALEELSKSQQVTVPTISIQEQAGAKRNQDTKLILKATEIALGAH